MAVRGREEGRKKGEGGKEEKKEKWKKRKRKRRNVEKEKKKRKERERDTVGIAAATATGLARAPVGCDAWDEDEQGDGTAMNSDVRTDLSRDREIGQGTILSVLCSTIEKRFCNYLARVLIW